LVDRKIGGTAGEYFWMHAPLHLFMKQPQPTFVRMVEWDMLLYGMEAEHAGVCAPGFYTEQARWYLWGHFPCGRLGNMLNGKPIVY
jgi:hypothetical protein